MLAWLGSEEEPWQGPRVRLYLVLDDNQVLLSPDQEAITSAFTDLFKEVRQQGREGKLAGAWRNDVILLLFFDATLRQWCF